MRFVVVVRKITNSPCKFQIKRWENLSLRVNKSTGQRVNELFVVGGDGSDLSDEADSQQIGWEKFTYRYCL